MKVTLENTDKIVELTLNGQTVPARIWEGVTAHGIACHAYITRIAVHDDDDAAEFERDLMAQRKASSVVAAIPIRLIISLLLLVTVGACASPTGPSATTFSLVRRDLTYAINIPDPQVAETLRRVYPDGIHTSPVDAQNRWNYTDLYHGTPNVYAGTSVTGGDHTYDYAGIVVAPYHIAAMAVFPASAWPNEYGQSEANVEYAWLGRFAYAIPRERP